MGAQPGTSGCLREGAPASHEQAWGARREGGGWKRVGNRVEVATYATVLLAGVAKAPVGKLCGQTQAHELQEVLLRRFRGIDRITHYTQT